MDAVTIDTITAGSQLAGGVAVVSTITFSGYNYVDTSLATTFATWLQSDTGPASIFNRCVCAAGPYGQGSSLKHFPITKTGG